MSDAMTDKDESCKGCINEENSYGEGPCNICEDTVIGFPSSHYTSRAVGAPPKRDLVKKPNHYMICDMEAIDIIQMALSVEEYKGYLFGNVLKYRLRAGKKDDTEQDIKKALRYEEMYRKAFGEMPR